MHIKESEDTGYLAVLWILVLFSIIPSWYWSAAVLQWLWVWFITPSAGWAMPSTVTAMGIILIVRFLTPSSGSKDYKTSSEEAWKMISNLWFYPTMVFITGWIIKTYA
jgi:hypothetical protein